MDKQTRDAILENGRLRVVDALNAAWKSSEGRCSNTEDLMLYQSAVLTTLLLELVPMVELLTAQLQEANLKLERIC